MAFEASQQLGRGIEPEHGQFEAQPGACMGVDGGEHPPKALGAGRL